jgi:F-type H+-transporting ATPase subunit delta
MTKTTVARRYAKALFQLLDKEGLETAQAGLQALANALQDSTELKHVLASPVFTIEEKSSVLTACSERAGCPPTLGRFCEQLLKKNRVGILPEIATAFRDLMDKERGKQQVSVTSAKSMDAGAKEELQGQLQGLLNQPVDVSFHEDPSLLSGIQIRIGSKVYDSTVKGRLQKMRTQLVKG